MNQTEMSKKHGEEWARFRDEILTPLYLKVADGDEKNAKSLADILKICQEGERKAWLFAGDGVADKTYTVAFEGE